MTRFPLEALLAFRGREADARRGELAAARALEAVRLASREARRVELEAKIGERRRRAADRPAADARSFAEAARFGARLRAEQGAMQAALLAEDARLRDAAARVARARDALAAARRAREVIEARRERWVGAERRRRERAEEAVADDRARPPLDHDEAATAP